MTNWNERGKTWSIILAGGEGERLRPLVQRWLGRHRPKQYCTFVGTRSMFQHTVDRAADVTGFQRTVVVAARTHRQEVRAQLGGRPVKKVLWQPANADTAAVVFLPLTYVRAHDPDASVVLFPSDHFVYPEKRFLDQVRQAIEAAERGDRLMLLGVRPDRLELEYGWIEPESDLADVCRDKPAWSVRAFLEKPDTIRADEAMRNGALWNTLVLAARAEVLWELGRRCFARLLAKFERWADEIDGPRETKVLEEIYADMPKENFSSDLLQRKPDAVAVMELRHVLWSDWGRPERIAETLQRINRQPTFPPHCLDRPFSPRATPLSASGT